MWVVTAETGRYANPLASMRNTGTRKMSTRYANSAYGHREAKPSPLFQAQEVNQIFASGMENSASQFVCENCLSFIRDQDRNAYRTWCSLSWTSKEVNMVIINPPREKKSLHNSLKQNHDNKRRTFIIREPKGCAAQRLFYQQEWILPFSSTTTLPNRFLNWPVIWLNQDWLATQL